MKPFIITCLGLLTVVLLSSCDGNLATDNGMLTVHNDTDQTILVYYYEEVETSQGVDREARETWIPVDEARTIFVDTLLWDGEVTVEYDGFTKVYDLDFDLSGIESLHVKAEDFLALPGGDG